MLATVLYVAMFLATANVARAECCADVCIGGAEKVCSSLSQCTTFEYNCVCEGGCPSFLGPLTTCQADVLCDGKQVRRNAVTVTTYPRTLDSSRHEIHAFLVIFRADPRDYPCGDSDPLGAVHWRRRAHLLLRVVLLLHPGGKAASDRDVVGGPSSCAATIQHDSQPGASASAPAGRCRRSARTGARHSRSASCPAAANGKRAARRMERVEGPSDGQVVLFAHERAVEVGPSYGGRVLTVSRWILLLCGRCYCAFESMIKSLLHLFKYTLLPGAPSILYACFWRNAAKPRITLLGQQRKARHSRTSLTSVPGHLLMEGLLLRRSLPFLSGLAGRPTP